MFPDQHRSLPYSVIRDLRKFNYQRKNCTKSRIQSKQNLSLKVKENVMATLSIMNENIFEDCIHHFLLNPKREWLMIIRTNIGNHVRLHCHAYIQVCEDFIEFLFIWSFLFYLEDHTFERGRLKLAPVTTVHDSYVLMSDSSLHGHNRVWPLTLVMKDDQMSSDTTWSGVPAQHIN